MSTGFLGLLAVQTYRLCGIFIYICAMKKEKLTKLGATIYLFVDGLFWAYNFPGLITWVAIPLLNVILLVIMWTRKWENT